MDDRSGSDYWFALYKSAASPSAPTYWLDGNPSTYRWWGGGDPNENIRCIRYTHSGFRDRSCSNQYQYTCKMAAGTCYNNLKYLLFTCLLYSVEGEATESAEVEISARSLRGGKYGN